jgi:hypothetical protein
VARASASSTQWGQRQWRCAGRTRVDVRRYRKHSHMYFCTFTPCDSCSPHVLPTATTGARIALSIEQACDCMTTVDHRFRIWEVLDWAVHPWVHPLLPFCRDGQFCGTPSQLNSTSTTSNSRDLFTIRSAGVQWPVPAPDASPRPSF